MPTYISVNDVAELLAVTAETVREWIRRGDLPAYKVGKSYRIREDELRQFVEGGAR